MEKLVSMSLREPSGPGGSDMPAYLALVDPNTARFAIGSTQASKHDLGDYDDDVEDMWDNVPI